MSKGNPLGAESKATLVVAGIFILLLTAFYWQVLFQNQIFVFVDASRFFYPLWKWGSDVLKQGWIPLWNPDAQFGTPYLADPQMAYAYPPVPLLYSLLSPVNAFAVLIILHHFWALLGFWVFARHEGFSARAAFLGSLIFGFSLHVVCSSWTPVALMTISWIPWIFFAVAKLFRGERGGFLYLSLAWAMQFAAGYPVLTYLTGLAVFFHLIWDAFRQEKICWSCLGRRLGLLAVAGLIAVAYNLVWGLPFAEFFRLSNYENGPSRYHDLGWLDFATLLSPFDQGHPLLPGYHGPHYWVSTYFLGLPTVCLLLWGAVRRTYKKAPWAIFPLFLILSLGVLGAGHLLKAILPGYSLVIHSGYWLSVLIFWGAWMAMESTEKFLDRSFSPAGGRLWIGIVAGVFLASFLVSCFTQAPLSWTAFGFSFGLAVITPLFHGSNLRWSILALALVISLGSAATSINILLDRSYYEKPPAALPFLTKSGRIFFTPPLLREAVLLQGENMSQAYEMAKEKMYPNWPLVYGMEEAPIYNTLQLKSSFYWTLDAFRYSKQQSRQLLDFLGIRYVFGKNNFKQFKPLGWAAGQVEVSENPSPRPKWFSVRRAIPEGRSLEDDFLKASKESMDFGKQCFIADPSKAGPYQLREVKDELRTVNGLGVFTKGRGKALIVSSELDYPGWSVVVDRDMKFNIPGKVKPIEQINHSFRGIVLDDGESYAIFKFEPLTFRLGLFFSLLVCGLWMTLGLKRVLA